MEQTELDLREIFTVLRRRLWMLLLMPLVAALVAGVVSIYLLQPVYSASTTLWVIKENSGQINYNDLMLSRNLTKTYAEVVKSRAVMADVIRDLKLQGVTITDLQKKLAVTPVRDTEILSFTIENSDPALAKKLADAVVTAFMAEIRFYMKVDNVFVVDQALEPTKPVRPRPLLNVAIAFLLGGMAAIGLAFVLEYLDTSVKTPEDVARHIGLPVLGIIPVIGVIGEQASPRRSRLRNHNTDAVVGK